MIKRHRLIYWYFLSKVVRHLFIQGCKWCDFPFPVIASCIVSLLLDHVVFIDLVICWFLISDCGFFVCLFFLINEFLCFYCFAIFFDSICSSSFLAWSLVKRSLSRQFRVMARYLHAESSLWNFCETENMLFWKILSWFQLLILLNWHV